MASGIKTVRDGWEAYRAEALPYIESLTDMEKFRAVFYAGAAVAVAVAISVDLRAVAVEVTETCKAALAEQEGTCPAA